MNEQVARVTGVSKITNREGTFNLCRLEFSRGKSTNEITVHNPNEEFKINDLVTIDLKTLLVTKNL